MRRFWPSALLLALLLLAGLMLKGGGNSTKDSIASTGSFIEGLRVINREGGVLMWSFTSKEAVLSEDGRGAYLKMVKASFPDRGIEVEANAGFYNLQDKDLSLRGGVKAETKDYTITTEAIKLHSGKELYADDRVVIEGKGLKIQGNRLRAKEEAWVLKDVTAVLF